MGERAAAQTPFLFGRYSLQTGKNAAHSIDTYMGEENWSYCPDMDRCLLLAVSVGLRHRGSGLVRRCGFRVHSLWNALRVMMFIGF